MRLALSRICRAGGHGVVIALWVAQVLLAVAFLPLETFSDL